MAKIVVKCKILTIYDIIMKRFQQRFQLSRIEAGFFPAA